MHSPPRTQEECSHGRGVCGEKHPAKYGECVHWKIVEPTSLPQQER